MVRELTLGLADRLVAWPVRSLTRCRAIRSPAARASLELPEALIGALGEGKKTSEDRHEVVNARLRCDMSACQPSFLHCE